MRTSHFLRPLAAAATIAMLSVLSLATTVLACTGGGSFPR